MRRPDGLLNHNVLGEDKGPQDACGVFGVWAPGEEVAKLTFYGLYALQHRGTESAGIATSDGERILVYKDMGLVSQVFTEGDLAEIPTPLLMTEKDAVKCRSFAKSGWYSLPVQAVLPSEVETFIIERVKALK